MGTQSTGLNWITVAVLDPEYLVKFTWGVKRVAGTKYTKNCNNRKYLKT